MYLAICESPPGPPAVPLLRTAAGMRPRELTSCKLKGNGGGYMSKELIRLVDCTMAFDDEVVLDNITLNIHDKEFLTLLGPSGCGKTTTLRIIGGFQTPTAGDVFFDGVRINAVPAHKRAINTVFQRYALFPHLNVFENIAFGLRIPKTDENGKKIKLSQDEIQTRVMEMLELVSLKGFEHRSVTSLSGGQQQRLCIARSLALQPDILLMDEPTSALDPIATKHIEGLMDQLKKEVTILIVTHNMSQAMRISDRSMFMYMGELIEYDNTEKMFKDPADERTRAYLTGKMG